MSDINELASYVRPLYSQFLENCATAGLDVVTIDIARTPDQQAIKISAGVSWTRNSKHLPQPPENLSEAFDVAPRELLNTKLWSPASPLWGQMGAIGVALGLVWGGDWEHHPDPSHFEYKRPLVPDGSSQTQS